MESILQNPVSLTASAASEIRRLIKEEAKAPYLRIGVKGGGCSGMTYVLDFDQKSENDSQFEIEGIPCIMDKSHALYLAGMEIDWSGGLNARGFTFRNPNAGTTCGCGSSFGL